MKNLKVFMIVVCFLAMNNIVFAGSANSEMEQEQEMAQQLIYAPTSKDNVSVGSLLHPGGHPRTGFLYIPSDQRSRQVNDLQGGIIANVLQVITLDGFLTFRKTADEINGKGYFKKLERNVKRMPTIIKRGDHQIDQVFILDELKAKDIQIRSGIEVHGIIAYDSKLDKKFPVTRQQLYMFAGKDALEITKSNVLIPLSDSLRNQFRASSFGGDLLGVISKLIAVQNPLGYAFGGGIDITAGKHTLFGETGATIAFVYIEPSVLAELLADPLKALARRMNEREVELAECTIQGKNNARLHTEHADDYVQLFKLSTDDVTRAKMLNGARFHYERALKNKIEDSEERRRVFGQLSKVYTELALQSEVIRARNDHARKAESFGKKAGFIEAHRLLANNANNAKGK